MNNYHEFLKTKIQFNQPSGFDIDVSSLNPTLFDYQRDIVKWAIRNGRAAIFAECGMGKTNMSLEWGTQIYNREGGKILLLAPPAVSVQTVTEGAKFGYKVNLCRNESDMIDGINITNYERLHLFENVDVKAVILDESSCLKGETSKYTQLLTERFAQTPYKLACTATPAPNDFMELGTHAEFLNVMSREEMLAMFFVHDGGDTAKWRLKGHAKKEFWKWVCSWAVMITKPSDLGYSDEGFELPELRMFEHIVRTDATGGFLFPMAAETLQERLAARRDSTPDRVRECSSFVNNDNDNWIIWGNLNAETDGLEKSVTDAKQISGSDNIEVKESRLLDFINGDISRLVTKPKIAGFGLNLQHCNKMAFVGLSDSYEQLYQAIRRCWRFGQKNPVEVHFFVAETEGNVLANIKRKERESKEMQQMMVECMKEITIENLRGKVNEKSEYKEDITKGDGWEIRLGDCIDHIKTIEDNSIHFSVFSPPFQSLYCYSNSDRDMGNCSNSDDFAQHFQFLIKELYRVIMPGRLVAFHCMNLPTSKVMDGYIGIRDFRGDLIRSFQEEGFIYHSEICIWKDPVTAMQRTKALGLLHKTIRKDSSMSRQGIPDYLVVMRKPGHNSEPIAHTHEEFPVDLWQKYASPVWFDINPSCTLQKDSAREHDDERHICPLQLQVIERALELWTNPNDIVLSPFAGIGSEGYVSIQHGRRFIGFELKESYYRQAVKNLEAAKRSQPSLFNHESA